jgi:hypothetical protein
LITEPLNCKITRSQHPIRAARSCDVTVHRAYETVTVSTARKWTLRYVRYSRSDRESRICKRRSWLKRGTPKQPEPTLRRVHLISSLLNLCRQFSMSYREAQRNERAPYPMPQGTHPDDDPFSMLPFRGRRRSSASSCEHPLPLRFQGETVRQDTCCETETCTTTYASSLPCP